MCRRHVLSIYRTDATAAATSPAPKVAETVLRNNNGNDEAEIEREAASRDREG